MNLTLISLLGGTLFFLCFIIFKIITSQTPSNIAANVNTNNKTIKNSFNTTNNNSVNINNITNIDVSPSMKKSSNYDISLVFLITFLTIVATTIFYFKYKSYINIFIIVISCLYLLLLGLHTYLKFNTRKMLISLIFSIFIVCSLLYFYYFPLYTPENIKNLYDASQIDFNLIIYNPEPATFILFKLAAFAFSISLFSYELFLLFVKKIYSYKDIFYYKIGIFIFIIIFESGLINKLTYFVQHIN